MYLNVAWGMTSTPTFSKLLHASSAPNFGSSGISTYICTYEFVINERKTKTRVTNHSFHTLTMLVSTAVTFTLNRSIRFSPSGNVGNQKPKSIG